MQALDDITNPHGTTATLRRAIETVIRLFLTAGDSEISSLLLLRGLVDDRHSEAAQALKSLRVTLPPAEPSGVPATRRHDVVMAGFSRPASQAQGLGSQAARDAGRPTSTGDVAAALIESDEGLRTLLGASPADYRAALGGVAREE
ncbi:MAG: Clp protease N-terminal domain-containing protein [Dehalococcoidia bacterium]